MFYLLSMHVIHSISSYENPVGCLDPNRTQIKIIFARFYVSNAIVSNVIAATRHNRNIASNNWLARYTEFQSEIPFLLCCQAGIFIRNTMQFEKLEKRQL